MDHFPVKLVGSQNAIALLTRKSPVGAVIFVHGFGGSAKGTWVDFEHLVEEVEEQRAWWSAYDLFFYGYRCHNQITPLAEELLEFLVDVAATKERSTAQIDFALPSSNEKMYASSLRLSIMRGNEPYKALVLVGHSAGAVIIREAIRLKLREIASKGHDLSTWLAQAVGPGSVGYAERLIAKALLRFFAPAHLGVMAAGLLGAASSLPRIGKVLDAYLRCSPLYQCLKPGCPSLADLRKETETLHEKHKFQALRALSVFGDQEDVVIIGGYCHDDVVSTEKGHGHTSICKPTREYTTPLEFVSHAPAIAKRV